jgi:hypothetical protein
VSLTLRKLKFLPARNGFLNNLEKHGELGLLDAGKGLFATKSVAVPCGSGDNVKRESEE